MPALQFVLSTWDRDSAETELRLHRAGAEMARQIERELAMLFGIAARALVIERGGRGCQWSAGSIRLETSGDNGSRQQAWDRARARFASVRGEGPALNGTLQNWDRVRQRLSTWLNSGTSVGLTTISEGRTLISWKYFHTAGYYVNPFTYWLESPAGSRRFVSALVGTPRALVTMGPTVLMLHEQDHQYGCVYGPNSRGACDSEGANPYHSAELATVLDTDIALEGHPDFARRGNYWSGADPRSQPGGRYTLDTPGEYVVWPKDQELRSGVR